MKRHWRRGMYYCILLFILLFIDVYVYAGSQVLRGPDAQLLQFLPKTGESLTERTIVRISAVVTLTADPSESVEFTSWLTVNGQLYRPFVNVLTPFPSGPSGTETLTETQTWFVCVTCPSLEVRLQLRGRKASGKLYEFVDVKQVYNVNCTCKRMHLRWTCCRQGSASNEQRWPAMWRARRRASAGRSAIRRTSAGWQAAT
jgi:hypothetical protein